MQTTLTIGELAQMTGITTHNLRVWEKRYDALNVQRLPSGHRRYPHSEVTRLRAISRALERGFKAGKVSSKSLEEINQLLGKDPSYNPNSLDDKPIPETALSLEVHQLLNAAEFYDDTSINSCLTKEWSKGPVSFVSECVGPFLVAVGERWEQGELSISQEHFASDHVCDFLAVKWRQLNEKNKKSPLVLTTLPNEPHRCGLLMSAVITAYGGRRVISLGLNTPVDEMIATVNRSQAVGLGISISSHYPKERSETYIDKLRKKLPDKIRLFVGGAGTPSLPEAVVSFSDWKRYFLWVKNQI